MRTHAQRTRTIFITCTTALMLALGFVHVTRSQAEAGRNKKAAGKRTPKEEALVELGRRLFFDPLVSRSGRRSCASCHDPDHGFSDPARVSDDDFGKTRRHSQTLLDTHRNPTAHWDGEFESVEELVLARVGALKGRKGKLGHGASVLDVVMDAEADDEGVSVEIFEDGVDDDGGEDGEESGEEDDVLDDGTDGGGGDDDGNSYDGASSREASSASAPKSRGASEPGKKGGEAAPAAGAPAAPAAPAPKPEPKPVVEKKKDADPPKADKAGEEKKQPTIAELKAKAEELRAELRKLPLAAEVLERGGLYEEAFEAAFGSRSVSTARIARAIAAYCDSLESTTAPFDRYLEGDAEALSESARRGLALFRGRAKCASCHTMAGKHPTFTDYAFHNTGVVWNGLTAQRRKELTKDDELFRRKKDDLERPKKVDGGRARISTLRTEMRAFKTATLRDLTRRGPYMHDGRFETLEDVVRYYAKGGSADPSKDADIHAFEASDEDVADLVAFLESLTGTARPGLPAKAWRHRAEKTRLRFVDADGRPLKGLTVRLTPVGDLAAKAVAAPAAPTALKTDAKGWVSFAATDRTHTRVTLPGALSPRDGTLVPDSCRKAKVVVPVRGRAVLVVRFPAKVTAPKTLVAEHRGVFVLPGHEGPRTRFEKTHAIDSGSSRVVRYEGWFRTDVPADVMVRVPGGKAKEAVLSPKAPARIDMTAN